MKSLTTEQIKARLAEIEKLQAAHDARDLDAELQNVMLESGNVDALEAKQLEDERAARRLRVERQALRAALPIATQNAAKAQLATLQKNADARVDKIAKLGADAAAIMGPATDQLEAIIREYFELERAAFEDFQTAWRIVTHPDNGLPHEAVATLGMPRSVNLDAVKSRLKAITVSRPEQPADSPILAELWHGRDERYCLTYRRLVD